MAVHRGGAATLESGGNGASPSGVRERFLKIDKPPFELDELVIRAQEQLREQFEHPERVGSDPLGSAAAHALAEAAEARHTADALERESEEAATARRAADDALAAAQAGRAHALEAQAAVRGAQECPPDDDRTELVKAARTAAQAAEDARGEAARARARAEQGDLREIASGLEQLQEFATAVAQIMRGIAKKSGPKGGSALAIAMATTGGSDVAYEDPLAKAAEAAGALREALERAVDALVDVVQGRTEAAAVAEQRADAARQVAIEAEADAIAAAGDDPDDTTLHSSPTEELLAFVARKGMRSALATLTALINRNGLTEHERLLLSTPGVYEWVLLRLLKEQGSPATDTKGLRLAVVAEIDNEPRQAFLEALLDAYIVSRDLDIDSKERGRLRGRLLDEGGERYARLGVGRTGTAMDVLFADERREGELPRFVRQFARRGEIDPIRFTSDVQTAMVDYLENLGLRGLDQQKVAAGRFDEYFVQAYDFALFGDGRSRPTKLRTVRPSDTDFAMETFELAEDQGVVREHLLAAAALYQICVLGDQAGILSMPTALMLRRARGRLDLSRGTGSQQLQEYKRYLRTAPLEAEDRQLLYRRVFNEGTGDVIDDAVANEEFPMLWDALMRQIGEYIRKTEENSSDLEDKISRGPVDEAVRNLQYNLSFFATDIAEDVRDLKEQYDLALGVLQNPDIISSVVTGPRQNMWTVIERLLADDIKKSPNVSAMRRLGVEGYRVLRYIADFEGPVSDEDFRAFIRSGEVWIIAQAALGPVDAEDEESDDETDDETRMSDDDWES